MKPNKFFAALTSIVLAAANSAILTPISWVSAETVSADEIAGGCTVNVSVVDIATGENLEGAIFELEKNPTGSSVKFGRWNTSDEPVKTVNGLYSYENYSINAVSLPEGYRIPENIYFSFDDDGEVRDYTIRVVPESADRNVYFCAYDWTDAVPEENGGNYTGFRECRDQDLAVEVYDEDGKRFTRETIRGNYSMYLPDGKYRIKVTPGNRDYETITGDYECIRNSIYMFDELDHPGEDGFVDIEVADGETARDILICIRMKPEIAEYIKDGCKANISVVDLYTNEPVEGIKLRLLLDVSGDKVITEWDTADEPIKNIKNLSALSWYRVEVADAPDEYNINKTTSFNLSNLGDTANIVIKAVPDSGGPNVDITVYDWTDLEVDPADGTYEGYKLMDPDDYTLMVYNDEQDRFDVTARDVHLPDGEYMAQILYDGSKYCHVDNQGWKARAVHRIFGKDFVIPDGISVNFEIKDGLTVGQPCLFVEKQNSKKPDCTLELRIVDGITGEPADAAEYEVIRIDEEYEEQVEKYGLSKDFGGFMPDYGQMPESGAVTVKELEPFVKYIIAGRSASKRYGGEKTELITFDNAGETKDVTIKLMPFAYKKGDVNGDGELGVSDLVMLQKWLLDAPDSTVKNAVNADLNEDGAADVFDLVLLRKELIKNIK